MSARLAGGALATALAVAGCAMFDTGKLEENAPGVVARAQANAMDSALQAQAKVRVGATRAEVAAALGPASGVRFDSGWEVWAYRWLGADHTARAATELVVLFDPAGAVRKTRVRPGYTTPP